MVETAQTPSLSTPPPPPPTGKPPCPRRPAGQPELWRGCRWPPAPAERGRCSPLQHGQPGSAAPQPHPLSKETLRRANPSSGGGGRDLHHGLRTSADRERPQTGPS